MQLLVRDAVSALPEKAMYTLLFVQLLLSVPVALMELDYAPVICFLGLNYLAAQATNALGICAPVGVDAAAGRGAAGDVGTMDDDGCGGAGRTRGMPLPLAMSSPRDTACIHLA